MKDSEILQEIRRMRFEEVYELRNEKRVTVEEAAQLLGMSSRNLRRYMQRYQEEGMDGLNDKRLAHAAHNAAPVDEVCQLVALYKTDYEGYTTAHFYEKYRLHHHGQRSYNWVRLSLQRQGLKTPKRQKNPHRKKRPRQPMVGMMLHQDASSHEWVPGKVWDLVVTLDDANSELYSAFFVQEEGTWSSLKGIKDVIETQGLFCSLYTDRASHYWLTTRAGNKVDKTQLTQVGRAMRQLGIEMIAAYSPQARGRSERMFGTLQQRLPQELKSAGITDMTQANHYLKHLFLPQFNQRFRVPAQNPERAFVPFQPGHLTLDDILCWQCERTVNKDNTIHYRGQQLQLDTLHHQLRYRKVKVTINEHLDGRIVVFHGPRKLAEFNNNPDSREKEGAPLKAEQRGRRNCDKKQMKPQEYLSALPLWSPAYTSNTNTQQQTL